MFPKMAARYWIYSILSFVGALAMVGGIYWLNTASKISVKAVANPPTQGFIASRLDPPFSNRHDVDALLAIDFSGSMRGTNEMEPSDPDDLRLDAAELMIASLAADVFPRTTTMGYVAFGTDATLLRSLVEVEDPNARLSLIESLRTAKYSGETNIVATLKLAKTVLLPDGQVRSDNTPALVLLTDGDPRAGDPDNNEIGIRKAVKELTDEGAILFIVILRNPNAQQEDASLSHWRGVWNQMANENPRLFYIEAQHADELEEIYNRIRARLVSEGAKPGERLEFDLTDPSAAITMPPNLLQAHLLVSKPAASTPVQVELFAPDGTPFSKLVEQDNHNEPLEGNLYNRYKINRPMAGKWKLQSNVPGPLYYVLNVESLYSARLARPEENAYVSPDGPTQLPFVVIGEDGRSTDKIFDLNASVIRNTQRADGAIVEEELSLPDPKPATLSDGTVVYNTEINAASIGASESVVVQVWGEAADSTPVNLSLVTLPVRRTPYDLALLIPSKPICSDEKLHIWPPSIECGNQLTATVTLEGGSSLKAGTLTGDLYPPTSTSGIPMTAQSPTTLLASFGPLTTAGEYRVAATVRGKLGDNLSWTDQVWATTNLEWPAWIPVWRERFLIGAVLLAICAIWKPILVALLLPLFRILRLAPSGNYSTDAGRYADSTYRTALERRKLFTVNMGCWESKALDVRTEEDCTAAAQSKPGRGGRIRERIALSIAKKPKGRIVAVPFVGTFTETIDGWVQAPDKKPHSVKVGKSRVLVCQSDWTDEGK